MMRKIAGTNAAVIGLLSFSALLIFVIQNTAIRRIKEFVLSSAANDQTQIIRRNAVKIALANWTSILEPLDWVVVFLLALSLVALVLCEIHRHALSRYLRELSLRPLALKLFLIGFSLVVTRYYLASGQIFMGDTETHTIRSWMVAEHLRKLQLPVWSNYWYGGFPLVQYYGPLFFTVVGAINVVVNDIHLATKLVLWISHVMSIFVMFHFLRLVTEGVLPALVGAAGYGLMVQRIYIVLYQGKLQLALVFLLYPLILLVCERHLKGRSAGKRSFLAFSFLVAALIITHHAYAFFGMVFIGIYLLIRILGLAVPRNTKINLFAFFSLGGLAAVFLSGFSLIPFIAEMHHVRGMPRIPFHLLWPSLPSLEGLAVVMGKLLRWTPVGSTGNVTYVGISVMLFAVVSVLYIIKTRMNAGMALAICMVLSFATLQSNAMYNVRNINFTVFFLTALTAFTPAAMLFLLVKGGFYEKLEKRWGALLESKIVISLLALMVLDLGPITFQNIYKEHGVSRETIYNRLLSIGGNYKVIERITTRYDPAKSLKDNFDSAKLGIPSVYAKVQTPLGWFHEGSPRSISYNTEMIKKLHLDLHQGQVSDLAVKGLYLMGVKFVLFRDRYQYFMPPLEPNPRYSLREGFIEFGEIRPLLVSDKLLHLKAVTNYKSDNIIEAGRYFDPDMYAYGTPHYEEIVRPLIDAMHIDLTRGRADYLIVRDDLVSPINDQTESLDVQVRNFLVSIDTITLRYISNGLGFGQLPYSYFPYLDVRVDGQPVPFYRSAMHTIVVPLHKGEHSIQIRGQASPLSKWTFLLSLSFILILAVFPSQFFRHFRVIR
ncbi:MAG: hypothetical protein HY695_10480 [Deltaproteobacteria bacterium]|nr:hypothetical protein [Deltaproteobacteria bacterium]